jgi:hypothetical protein
MAEQKHSVTVRGLGGKKATLKVDNDFLIGMDSMRLKLGLSQDRAFQLLQQLNLLKQCEERVAEDALVALMEKRQSRMTSAPTIGYFSFKKAALAKSINLNLALPSRNKTHDPITRTLAPLCERFDTSKSGLLRMLYTAFLLANGLWIPDWSSEEQLKWLYREIAEKTEYQQFGWKVPPLENFKDIESGKVSFDFLIPVPKTIEKALGLSPPPKTPRRFLVNLRFKDYGTDPIRETLPRICALLWRDQSSFFQMLIMYYLRTMGIVDRQFILHADFERRIANIIRFDREELSNILAKL